jgi:hypothetical protein
MKEQLITFQTAKLAKEKGFDEIVDYIYMTNHTTEVLFENINDLKHSDGNNPFVSAPTQSLLQKWLRDEHNIHIDIHAAQIAWNNKCSYLRSVFKIKGKHVSNEYVSYRVKEVKTYEEALEEGLQEALKLIK